MKDFQVHMVPCLHDNYGFILADLANEVFIAIDTPDEDVITKFLEERNWNLSYILNTHHHHDHVGGNSRLKQKWNCYVYCSVFDFEKERIPAADEPVREGDTLMLGSFEVNVLEVPGHTLGHLAYYFPKQKIIFVGDTLFALGCGRLFEGTPEVMHQSLRKLIDLPNDTLVYCAHEYTEANLDFALTIEPQNQKLLSRSIRVATRREAGLPTIPTSIGEEKETNPFLRSHSKSLRNTIGMLDSSDTEVFGEVRRRKDLF